ncbi:hypothetical protein H5410_019536 [Solanum commersonii]|uniref:Uncharacterized protein n=1 Tax=Solanum commersonii TaxID=4109 RepID=A0A9J5Z8M4_SOLCO|nr:hypothetical protein H5410_019536 [Solanum commersonii]
MPVPLDEDLFKRLPKVEADALQEINRPTLSDYIGYVVVSGGARMFAKGVRSIK